MQTMIPLHLVNSEYSDSTTSRWLGGAMTVPRLGRRTAPLKMQRSDRATLTVADAPRHYDGGFARLSLIHDLKTSYNLTQIRSILDQIDEGPHAA